jgi:hypothetical protein
MTNLIEQSRSLVQLQEELERLKTGSSTIHEFSTSALRAVEFMNRSQSDYQQMIDQIHQLEQQLVMLKERLGDSQLQTLLDDIAKALHHIEQSSAEFIPQVASLIVEQKQLEEKLTIQISNLHSDNQLSAEEIQALLNGITGHINRLIDWVSESQSWADTVTQSMMVVGDRLGRSEEQNSTYQAEINQSISQLQGMVNSVQTKQKDDAIVLEKLIRQVGIRLNERLKGEHQKSNEILQAKQQDLDRKIDKLNKLLLGIGFLVLISLVLNMI